MTQAFLPRDDRESPMLGDLLRARRPFVSRQLLGLGVALLTLIPAVAVSRSTAASATPQADPPFDLREDRSLDSHIKAVAARYSLSESLVLAVIEAESGFDRLAVSRRGARGLMQLMPATAERLGLSDPFDPRANVEAGVRHLRALMDRFGNNVPLALAAYNAGERAVTSYRGIPPYRETRQYVSRILRRLDRDGVKAREVDRRRREA